MMLILLAQSSANLDLQDAVKTEIKMFQIAAIVLHISKTFSTVHLTGVNELLVFND